MLRSNLLRGQVSQSYESLPVVLWHFKPGIIVANSQWNFPRYSSHKIVLSSVGSQNVVGHLGHAIINATKSPSGVMKTVFVGLKYTFISEAFINQFTVILKRSRWDVKTFQIIKHVISIDAAGSLNIKSVSVCAGLKCGSWAAEKRNPGRAMTFQTHQYASSGLSGVIAITCLSPTWRTALRRANSVQWERLRLWDYCACRAKNG